jgi:hypothetical protein
MVIVSRPGDRSIAPKPCNSRASVDFQLVGAMLVQNDCCHPLLIFC